MLTFDAVIKKFGDMGEKTGWTYIEIPQDISDGLKPGWRRSFRVKGKIDDFNISGMAVLPMGGGGFILVLNADIRKGIGKRKGAMVKLALTEDKSPLKINQELMECLADEPEAKAFFDSLAPGHRNYFSKWIDSAKTDTTKTKRIAATVNAMVRKMDYGQMIRALRNS